MYLGFAKSWRPQIKPFLFLLKKSLVAEGIKNDQVETSWVFLTMTGQC